jgi:hypothetical protein
MIKSICIFFLSAFVSAAFAQPYLEKNKPQWTLFTSMQISGGSYFYNSYSSLYMLYGGVRYQNNDFSITGYIPVVAQNNHAFTQAGMMMLPTGMEEPAQGNTGHHSGGMGMSLLNLNYSLGDLFVSASYRILNELNNGLELSLNPGIKFPTASRVGTGEFDYSLSLNANKSDGSFIFFADAGFIKFGDPAGINYNDPFTYGLGVGKFISEQGNSLLLYFNGYTKIINEYEPPRQISLGLNLKLAERRTLTFTGSKGLSRYSSDFSLSAGFNLAI